MKHPRFSVGAPVCFVTGNKIVSTTVKYIESEFKQPHLYYLDGYMGSFDEADLLDWGGAVLLLAGLTDRPLLNE